MSDNMNNLQIVEQGVELAVIDMNEQAQHGRNWLRRATAAVMLTAASFGVMEAAQNTTADAETICVLRNPDGSCAETLEVDDDPVDSGTNNSGNGSNSSSSQGSNSNSSNSSSNSNSGSSSSSTSGNSTSGKSSNTQASSGPTWNSLIADQCADHAGDPELAAQLEAARGSHDARRFVIAVAECGVFFMDDDGDGQITTADSGDTYIDRLLSDQETLGNRSTNDMTAPNQAMSDIYNAAKQVAWEQYVPPVEEVTATEEAPDVPVASSVAIEAIEEDVAADSVVPAGSVAGFRSIGTGFAMRVL